MAELPPARVCIVDYALGNLYSVARACEHAGLEAVITADKPTLGTADAIILPGVGAFGSAMESLRRLDLVSPLRAHAARGGILMGVCLGMQLFMRESEEFGRHRGLELIDGAVVRFKAGSDSPDGRRLKVPEVGWNKIVQPGGNGSNRWASTLLAGLGDGAFMYFVHSFYAVPANPEDILSRSHYGGTDFCSSIARGHVFGCQFHPERSGAEGLKVYDNLAHTIRSRQAALFG